MKCFFFFLVAIGIKTSIAFQEKKEKEFAEAKRRLESLEVLRDRAAQGQCVPDSCP